MGDVVKGKQCPVHKNCPPNSMTNDITYVINVGWNCEWSNYMCSQQPAHIALDEHRAQYFYSNSANEWCRKMGNVGLGQYCPVHILNNNTIDFISDYNWSCELTNSLGNIPGQYIEAYNAMQEHTNTYYWNASCDEWLKKIVIHQDTFTIPPHTIEPKVFIKVDMYPHKCPRCGGTCYIGINTDHELAARNDTCK